MSFWPAGGLVYGVDLIGARMPALQAAHQLHHIGRRKPVAFGRAVDMLTPISRPAGNLAA